MIHIGADVLVSDISRVPRLANLLLRSKGEKASINPIISSTAMNEEYHHREDKTVELTDREQGHVSDVSVTSSPLFQTLVNASQRHSERLQQL